jgi:DMSO reductase anchor subunit
MGGAGRYHPGVRRRGDVTVVFALAQVDSGMQPLAILFLLIFAELAVGGMVLIAIADYEGIATKGFLGVAAGTYFVVGLGAWWARGQTAAPAGVPGYPVDDAWLRLEAAGLLVFLVGVGVYALLLFGSDRRLTRAAATVAVAGGLVSLLASGMAYRVAHLGGLSTVVSVISGAVVLGAAMSGMILGHWYLVTPGLSPRPLVTMTLILIAALVTQAVAIVLWLPWLGADAVGPSAEALVSGIYAIPFWMRILVGIILPLVVGAMTWHCCRIRSLQSATGLLYVAVALVLGGEIAAKLLLVLAATPL